MSSDSGCNSLSEVKGHTVYGWGEVRCGVVSCAGVSRGSFAVLFFLVLFLQELCNGAAMQV